METSKNNLKSVFEEQKRLSNAGRLHWFHWFIVAGSLVLTMTAWYFTNNQVKQKTQDQFDRQSNQVIELISERMQKYEDALWSGVAAIHFHSSEITHSEWRNYAQALQIEEKYPGINGIGVIYYVEQQRVNDFLDHERSLRPDFRIHPQHDRDVFLPITYIEPVESNAKAVGLDMSHEVNRFTAAIKARDTGEAQITGQIVLVQDSEKTPGFLFYVPFYFNKNIQHQTLDERKKDFHGLVYAPFIFKKLLEGTLDEAKRSVGLRIQDNNDTLYDELIAENEDFDPNPLFKQSISVNIYGRQWDFSIWTTKTFRKQNQSNQPWIILASGIFIDTLLLTLFILLARSNRNAINFAHRLTNNYKEKANELESANAELEEFSYRTSHDLRSPITSSIGLLNVAQQFIQKNDADKVITSINHAQKSLTTLKTLIDDILTLTKTKNVEEESVDINLSDLIDESLEAINHMENFNQLEIIKNFQLTDKIHSKKLRLRLIIDNLLSNAVKYQDPEKENSFLKISTRSEGDDFVIDIEDNGLGVPKNLQNQLFLMFKRFHPKTAYGNGLGLYIIKKSAIVIEGEIYFADTGNGSNFSLKASKKVGDENEKH